MKKEKMTNNFALLNKVLEGDTNVPFVIAEVGQAHEGSLGQALSFIDAASLANANAIKFQTHFADEESSKYDEFRVPVFPQDSTRKDYWQRMEFEPEEWKLLAARAKEKNIVFLSSPFSKRAVDTLINCDVQAWKIASGELFNYPMLDKIIETGKPMLISTGMSNWEEIDKIHKYTAGRRRVIFQCTTEYPSKPTTIGINNIEKLRQRYNDCVIGLSDHSGEIYPSMSAYMLGARVFEVHVTWSKQMFGPDTSSSLTFDELSQLTRFLELQHQMLVSPVSKDKLREEKQTLSVLFGRGIYAKNNIHKGQVICGDDLQYLKPAMGVPAQYYKRVIGETTLREINAGEPLKVDDVGIKI